MKKLLLAAALSCYAVTSLAQLSNGNASQFAEQAGTIAGAAQACGQDITIFNSRVNDVVNVLGNSLNDRQTAMTVYQQALSQSQYAQSRTHTLNCGQVINSFLSLPLMRSDFQQSVLPQMASLNNPSAATNNTAPATPSTTTTNQNSVAALPQNTMPVPNSNNTQPATPPSNTQMMVTGSNQ